MKTMNVPEESALAKWVDKVSREEASYRFGRKRRGTVYTDVSAEAELLRDAGLKIRRRNVFIRTIWSNARGQLRVESRIIGYLSAGRPVPIGRLEFEVAA